ncbi:hypothetical protein ABAC402_10645 [Asticcacaulis sp. AC402]|nr:hypothetical protein ABAC402_10645 [Asticcacaulis sp. AC402]
MGLTLAAGAAQAGDTQWKTVAPENVLVVDTAKGRIFVELHPEVAPKAVERIKLLTRRGTYDGLQFWRVAPNFVVQIDVGNVEGGKTELPNLPPEFRFRLGVDAPHTVIARPQGLESGFIGAMPYIAVEKNSAGTPKAADGSRSAWISYCTGVVGMGRDAARDSANAEVFFMTGAYPGIDREFTPVGRVVVGQDILAGLPQGEPPAAPDVIRTVRILADVRDGGRLEVEDTAAAAFAAKVAATRTARGADFSVCDVPVAGRITP